MNLTKTNKLILATFAFVAVFALGGGRAHAATLTVGSGCTTADAIDSVNAGSDQASCGSSSYGTNDTINIPAGTQTLTADLPTIVVPVTVKGAGMGKTIIDGDNGQYQGFSTSGADLVTFKDMTITAYDRHAIYTGQTNVVLDSIEVDGSDSLPDDIIFGIEVVNDDSGTFTLDSNNVYLHDIHASSDTVVVVFGVNQVAGGTTNATIQNTTAADITSTDGALNGISLAVGAWYGFGGAGTVNTTITNTTVTDLVASNAISAPFGSVAFASGGAATINSTVNNVTVTGTRGITSTTVPTVGIKSGAFYSAAAGIDGGSGANVAVEVGNSLLADNMTDTTSNNCQAADLTSNFGGAGTGTATISSLGHNMSDDASCTSFTQTGDQQNISSITSTLGPLQNNGGEVPTRALLDGSPAIAAGGAVLGITTDARGIARPSSNPSVGAYQYVLGDNTTTAAAGGGTTAPDTGIGSATQVLSIFAGVLGLGILAFVSLKQKRST